MMTGSDAAAPGGAKRSLLAAIMAGRTGPIMVVTAVLIAVWYVGTVWMNSAWEIDRYKKQGVEWSLTGLISATMSQERPVLPAPHQVLREMWETVAEKKITSKRSLVLHSWVTLSSTLLGFAIGGLLGILLAVAIVHNATLERSLLPWVISSQTIPILAIAPMIIVVLGAIGLKGLVPKAIISAYLCFFPIAIGMVKGLRSPGVLELDLMRTYSATRLQTFWKLRAPSSTPFLFASLKVGVAISLVGAIVGELPTGAQAGLGARLLSGSYYGQTIQIWSALVAAAIMAALLVTLVGVIERFTLKRMGMTP